MRFFSRRCAGWCGLGHRLGRAAAYLGSGVEGVGLGTGVEPVPVRRKRSAAWLLTSTPQGWSCIGVAYLGHVCKCAEPRTCAGICRCADICKCVKLDVWACGDSQMCRCVKIRRRVQVCRASQVCGSVSRFDKICQDDTWQTVTICNSLCAPPRGY